MERLAPHETSKPAITFPVKVDPSMLIVLISPPPKQIIWRTQIYDSKLKFTSEIQFILSKTKRTSDKSANNFWRASIGEGAAKMFASNLHYPHRNESRVNVLNNKITD